MKQLLFSIAAAILLLAGCETGPKTYNYQDVSFTYPATYSLENEKITDSMVSLIVSKDDDNFMIVNIIPLDEDLFDEFDRSDIQSSIEEDALDLLMMDLDDEEIEIDKDSISSLSSPEGSVPGVLLSYDGTYFGDPFKGRISVTILRNYQILLKYEASNDKSLDELTDIATSFNVE